MVQHRKFITNLFILLLLNLLIKPFWILGIDRTVQNTVGAESFGFYFAIFNLTFLFNILLDLGLTNFNNKNIAQNNHLLNKHFSSLLILKFLLAIIYCVITLSAGLIIGYSSQQMMMLLVLCFNQFLISFILYLRSNISGLHFFKTDAIISVLDRVIMIIICGALLWGNIFHQSFRIEWFIFAQTASYIITAFVALFIVIKKAHFSRLHWNRLFFFMIIKKSFPFAVLVLLMTFYNRIDSVMIERLLPGKLGDQQAGLYASAYRLLDASNMIAYLFAVILLPLFARMLKFKENIEDLTRLSFTLLFILSITVAMGSFFYRLEIMTLLYPQHINEAIIAYNMRIAETSWIFGILMIGFIPISTTYVFGTLLTANGNLKYLNIVAFSGMVMNLILNFILIPKLQSTGSAYASIITQMIMAFIQVYLVIRIFKFKFNVNYILRLIVFLIAVFVFCIVSLKLSLDWRISFIVMVTLSIITAALTNLLNIRSFIAILKKEDT
jgi:O-antigen/teichoic acid export membrane protein